MAVIDVPPPTATLSLRDIAKRVASLNLVISPEAITALAASPLRERFLVRLNAAERNDPESTGVMSAFATLLAAETRTALGEGSVIRSYTEILQLLDKAPGLALAQSRRMTDAATRSDAIGLLRTYLNRMGKPQAPASPQQNPPSAPAQPSRSRDAGANQPQPTGADARAQFEPSIHVYAKSNALCFSADNRRGSQRPTISVDAAASIGERTYDWKEKVSLQFTEVEVSKLLWVLRGLHEAVRFEGHGPGHDKSFEIRRQPGGYYAKVCATGINRSVPIPAEYAEQIAYLLIRQMMAAQNLDAQTILAINASQAQLANKHTPRDSGAGAQ